MKFAILIYEGVEPIDVGATAGVLSMARRFQPDIEMFSVAEKAGEVVLASGVRTIADYDYDTCPDYDVLIVTGGPGWVEQCDNAATLAFIKGAGGKSTIASVCTGGMILAAAGMADGIAVTTRRLAAPGEQAPLQRLGDYAPLAKPVAARVVDSGTVISGGGVTLAIDVMFHLLEKFYGEEVKNKTAELMEYDRALVANSNHLDTIHWQSFS